jgi:hypothetical protein
MKQKGTQVKLKIKPVSERIKQYEAMLERFAKNKTIMNRIDAKNTRIENMRGPNYFNIVKQEIQKKQKKDQKGQQVKKKQEQEQKQKGLQVKKKQEQEKKEQKQEQKQEQVKKKQEQKKEQKQLMKKISVKQKQQNDLFDLLC